MCWTRAVVVSLCVLLGAPSAGWAGEADTPAKSSYLLRSSVIGAAGCPGSGSGQMSNGTLGQSTPIGIGSREDRVLYAGFWFGLRSMFSDIPESVLRVNVLHQNHPNPFNPVTTIRFNLAKQSLTSLKVYDISGRCVATLLQESLPPGPHAVVWRGNGDEGRRMASGLYFYRLEAGDYLSVKKMLLLK